MLAAHQELIRREVAEGTGADIGLEASRSGLQTGLSIWFADLGRPRSPIVDLLPRGLTRYEARLRFGNLAAETISQMMAADEEERQLARALVQTIARDADVTVPGQTLGDWVLEGPGFSIVAERRGISGRFDDGALVQTCRDMVIPMLAAMAELYGYDPVGDPDADQSEVLLEGAVRVSVVKRRERNPRNRLLCLRIHGTSCRVCGLDPRAVYGDAGSIIEVHHIQPLSSAEGARPYDPATDLIPLCPNCHRAAHTRRPLPWSPEELREQLGNHG